MTRSTSDAPERLNRLRGDAPRERTKPVLPSQLRDVLSQALRDCDLTQAEIARRSNVSRSTVSLLLHNRRPGSMETWEAILAGCDIVIGYRFKTRAEKELE